MADFSATLHTNDGRAMRGMFGSTGRLAQSHDWGVVWALASEGKLRTVNHGPTTYGHVDFWLNVRCPGCRGTTHFFLELDGWIASECSACGRTRHDWTLAVDAGDVRVLAH